MKTFIKLPVCIMLLVVLVVSFTSCTKDETIPVNSNIENKENKIKEEKVKKTAMEFMDALCNMDSPLMMTMCENPQSLKKRFPFDDFKSYVQMINTVSMSGEDEAKKIYYVNPCLGYYADKVINANSYTIKEVIQASNGYEVTVEVEAFDVGDVTYKVATVMKEDILKKRGTEISKKILENGTVNELSTEEEMVSALYKGAAEEIIPMIDSALDSSEKIKDEYILYIVEKDGKLLVDVTRSTVIFAFSPKAHKIY